MARAHSFRAAGHSGERWGPPMPSAPHCPLEEGGRAGGGTPGFREKVLRPREIRLLLLRRTSASKASGATSPGELRVQQLGVSDPIITI